MSTLISNRSYAVAAWRRLNRVQQRLSALTNQRFAREGLNDAWFDVLVHVGAQEGITQGALADSLLVTKGNISQLIAKMVQAGLVIRTTEGRCHYLSLSEKGHELRTRTLGPHERFLGEAFQKMTRDEQSELTRLLKKWEEAL